MEYICIDKHLVPTSEETHTVQQPSRFLSGKVAALWGSNTVVSHLVSKISLKFCDFQKRTENLSYCVTRTLSNTSGPMFFLVYTLLAAVKASLSRMKVYATTSKARSELQGIERQQ